MNRNKLLKVVVVLFFVLAVGLAPAAAWGDTPRSRAGQHDGTFTLNAFEWLASAWNWLIGDFGADSGVESLDKVAFTPAEGDGGGGGTQNSTNGGGGAGPGIDPDGKP